MLTEDRRSFTAFVAHYEHNAVFKALQTEPVLDVKGVLGLLGLEESDPDAPTYARALLRQNADFDADGLIVPGIGSGPDPLFVQRLTGLFNNPDEAHSRGQLLNQLRKI